MGVINFRAALPEDDFAGAQLVLETLHTYGDHLFGFGSRSRALSALRDFFRRPGNRFSYDYAEFALLEGRIAGILMTFDQRQMRKSMLLTALHMLRVYRMDETIRFLNLMIPYQQEEIIPANELYIGHLAVCEEYRRQGVGVELLAHAEARARAMGKAKLSLLTEVENTAARGLYEKAGFALTETILFPEAMRFVGSAGDVRMIKTLN